MDGVEVWGKKCWTSCFHKRNVLTFVSLAGVTVGVTVGLVLKSCVTLSARDKHYIRFPEELLYNFLQLVSVPLLVTNVIAGVANAPVSPSRKITVRALTYFVITTILALLSGVLFVQLIKPGVTGTSRTSEEDDDDLSSIDAFMDLIRNMVPQNMIQACFQYYKTRKVLVKVESRPFNTTLEEGGARVQLVGETIDGINVLGLVVVSTLYGMALRKPQHRGPAFLRILHAVNLIAKLVMKMIMHYFPIGVAFMMMNYVYEVSTNWATALSLVKFLVVVFCGLALHGFIVLPFIHLLFTGQNPVPVIKGISPALLNALLVSRNSAASQTYERCEQVLRLDTRVTQYVLAVANHAIMNGAALHEMAAVVYVAQLTGITLNWSELFTTGVTVAVATVGEAGTPDPEMATTLFILIVSRIPARAASVLLAVRWLLDHLNAAVSVMGECFGAALVHNLSKEELERTGEEPAADSSEASPSDAAGPSREEENSDTNWDFTPRTV
ncbi:excitatory amino acid transporter 3-like [Nematolebias whitei]|uniref:excitatory amino acid transporter 3-like n=1 Tax=Nematolebias whitei TaxID=451745 RepID=UPI00189B52FB|nr:excitatory amino acid transporter 3-like [Nematolebias whitei]